MKETSQDIQRILEQFVDAQTAGRMVEDIQRADELMSAAATVKVRDEMVAAIREKVHRRLAARKIRNIRIRIEKFVIAAAAIIIVAVLAEVFFNSQQDVIPVGGALTTLSIWNDTDVSVLKGQVETLSNQMDKVDQTAVQWLDENNGLTVEVDNLEEVALNTEFWKG
ncbi:MAG: hypothetical protein FJ263_02865 [Planctomycetes bacterium]|nr:hypothetical protein [Planctomycetota bacterium]